MEMWQLQQRQSLPLAQKVRLSEMKIQRWYEYWQGQVHVAFSGGKDSTVLLHLVRSLYPRTPAVFCDTGLEYPEIRDFVRTIDNVTWLRPKKTFKEVIKQYGYPVVSKEQARYLRDVRNPTDGNAITRRRRMTGVDRFGIRRKSGKISEKWKYLINAPFKISEQCCYHLKKGPARAYYREFKTGVILGTMAVDSRLRMGSYLRRGCNSFGGGWRAHSQPLAFWTEKDIWDYLYSENLLYSKIYDMGESRTGCMFCMFGIHLEKEPNRFQRMKISHPIQYDYCINKLGCGKILEYMGVSFL